MKFKYGDYVRVTKPGFYFGQKGTVLRRRAHYVCEEQEEIITGDGEKWKAQYDVILMLRADEDITFNYDDLELHSDFVEKQCGEGSL